MLRCDGRVLTVAVLMSGRGSNLAAIVRRCHGRRFGGRRVVVRLVVSARAGAPALERARRAGIEALAFPPADFPSQPAYFRALLRELQRREITLVCLAGFLLRVPPFFVRAYRGRILNIHPALLPAFGGRGMFGLRVHRAVLRAGVKLSGCTVHLVDEQYDHGPILLQKVVPVRVGDTPRALAARVLRQEHRLYPEAVRLMAATL